MSEVNRVAKGDSKEEIIQQLASRAKLVRELVEERRKRRPVLIEFAGAPKSGKTSSIHSLRLFLKKNGFKVAVVQEAAAICPVDDKHSPMFNIWTACHTLCDMVGMLESLNRKAYDVVIIDRGIFDALCWFEWLFASGKMELQQKKVIDSFLLQEVFLTYIDLVIVFQAKPQVSIEREYASLLTTVEGSIMNQKVLGAYGDAVDKVCEERKVLFDNIYRIDTSDKSQNDVGKMVTERVLQGIEELFMEEIGFIIPDERFFDLFSQKAIIKQSCFPVDHYGIRFGSREKLERDLTRIQVVPIAVIEDKIQDKILVVKKQPKAVQDNSPEKEKVLCYVGGHVRKEDANGLERPEFEAVCRRTLHRELSEELGIALSLDEVEPFFIYLCEGEKSRIHLAVCYRITVDAATLRIKIDTDELISPKGRSISGKFMDLQEIQQYDWNPWSVVILNHFYQANISRVQQITLFDGENGTLYGNNGS